MELKAQTTLAKFKGSMTSDAELADATSRSADKPTVKLHILRLSGLAIAEEISTIESERPKPMGNPCL